MNTSTVLFAAVAVLGVIMLPVAMYTYYKFRRMKEHPEEFPETFEEYRPEEPVPPENE